ncbi:MAG: hypothetical protein ACLUHE_02780 [Christensenellales bacterium]
MRRSSRKPNLSFCAWISGERSISTSSPSSVQARMRRLFPPSRIERRQTGQAQNVAGMPSAAPVPRY